MTLAIPSKVILEPNFMFRNKRISSPPNVELCVYPYFDCVDNSNPADTYRYLFHAIVVSYNETPSMMINIVNINTEKTLRQFRTAGRMLSKSLGFDYKMVRITGT